MSTSGSGTLSGVASLTSNGNDIGYGAGYCALLTSGRVDCWGYGFSGELGNGKFYTSGNLGSAKPGAVVSTSGSGTLSGVASLTGNRNGYCALLTSGRVDCWGYGFYGQLGNGPFYTSGNQGSAIPVAVVSTSGSGTLSGVASLTSDYNGNGLTGTPNGYCALLTSGGVDCWGYGNGGQLGNGKFYTSGNQGSAKPVAVVSTSGSGTLSGVKLH